MTDEHFNSWADSLYSHFLKKPFRISLTVSESNLPDLDLVLTKPSSDVVNITVSPGLIQQEAFLLRSRIESCLRHWVKPFWKSKVPVGQAIYFDCGDIGSSKAFSMDGPDENRLIPDIYAFDTAARLSNLEQQALEAQDFIQFRHNWNFLNRRVFWRGSSTGFLPNGELAQTVHEFVNIPRISICLREKFNFMTDLKISQVVQAPPYQANRFNKFLRRNFIYSDPVPEVVFGHFRYYPDIPGNACAWGTIKKHLRGSLVFRIMPTLASHKLYYYRFMKPWKHYIPVKSDFSDLSDRYTWAENNPEESAFIAWEGHNAAKNFLKKINKYFQKAIETNSMLFQ